MPYARNATDGCRVYFEDDGGEGPVVLVHGGFGEPVDLVRSSRLVQGLPTREFRLVHVDHRGHGGSDRPHDAEAYAMPLRVADAVAVLDELGVERAHFVGISWGGRLGFGIGEHAPDRVLSLVIGGQQPYSWPRSPLVRLVTEALATARIQRTPEPLLEAFEEFWGVTFPEERRTALLANDPVALDAAWRCALAEGSISEDLRKWRVRCLIFVGAADADFLELAQRAADEIPGAEFVSLVGRDHYQAHTGPDDPVVEAIVRTLRGAG